MNFPNSTQFNRKLPKQRFYENLSVSAPLKKMFVEQIKAVYWQNKLSADTINLTAGEKVTEIEIMNSVETIGSYAISECSSLEELLIPENVKTLESYSITNCPLLTSLTLPSTITSIEEYGISQCESLVNLYHLGNQDKKLLPFFHFHI